MLLRKKKFFERHGKELSRTEKECIFVYGVRSIRTSTGRPRVRSRYCHSILPTLSGWLGHLIPLPESCRKIDSPSTRLRHREEQVRVKHRGHGPSSPQVLAAYEHSYCTRSQHRLGQWLGLRCSSTN